ncbi:flagellar hook capping protein [Solidesulfovibrio fructosivorans JJ]]|uniref:Basal-body rod modification protein FlgD n=1 Tax=Solidesulfovibrio fructosivorans JJ] TaxID=596151 RepID=E1K0M1_SOLFR|nr:flagellar hook assembly protein FlgD [Solidesulfovibrio fructosivorans]EFL49873.1 flagellar hook capping protein [Solidesulfovibrio fructosivorans JJ]]
MSYVSSILGADTSTTSTTSKTGAASLGQDAFLQLLVTQLQYQDPLSPMDDKDFVAELAQFSSLEQLTEINTGIDKLADLNTQSQVMGAVNFIGKTIEANGEAVSLTKGKATPVTFTLPEDASTCLVNVLDSAGTIVRTVDLDAKKAGEVEFTWDGKDHDGNVCDDGQYRVAVTATNADSEVMKVSSTMTGTVVGVTQQNGTYYLNIGGNRYVAFGDITNVIDKTSSNDSDSGKDSGSNSGSDSSS